MPGRNHTGPYGAGPRIGRGMGRCGSSNQNSFTTPGRGMRGGIGCSGAGRGWRHRFLATGTPGWAVPTQEPADAPEQEIADLKDQVEQLRGELDALQKRIETLITK